MTDWRPEELLICRLADALAGDRHVAVGAASPIPGAAALLAQEEAPRRMHVTVLHSRRYNHFTDGGRELFDCAGQGRIDTFFLGGVQIDGQANINLVGTGDYPTLTKRFPGSFGSAFMYFAVPKVILFREEHSPRTLVEKVDFVSAPGCSPEGTWRRGGPTLLVTSLAVFAFDGARRRFALESLHPGVTAETVAERTGFAFDRPAEVPTTAAPEPARLERLRRTIAPKVAEFYPVFAERVFGVTEPAA
ncbi:glutaconate CoA-transferase subunit B [Tistlia consotensis]|uniref:Glutaconate CoA-transferase subunit B n=1 Tax=Tistlia consotensis USBA 355 TaxID=560819 RepID=A0A1Y6C2K5_9PROT|nr:CoA-transferase [Tistlia consotensis]SMF30174.1 glutaconate CoA-transferase subunit B [Tistlia consotensis USBA 355]SNR90343.1 glutaconate CoA-transferase subunit B [Tistlia consotensis]